MNKKYLLFLLSIILTFSFYLPINVYANTLGLNYISSFSNDKLLCDGAPASVMLLTGNTVTGEVTGSGQPGASITFYLGNATYTTTVGPDGLWSVICDPPPQIGDLGIAIQVDANGNETSYSGILGEKA